MNNKKKILAIVLAVVVVLLGGASIYVATQLSSRQAVAPTAPTSKPSAADCTSLSTQATCDAQTTPDCTWFPTCNKCATAGTAAETVCPTEWVGNANCTVAGVATDSAVVVKSVLKGSKKAYKNDSSNTAGSYTLTNEMTSVSKSQIYVYSIELNNTSTVTAQSVVIKDSLKDKTISFMDTSAGCTFSATDVELTCNTSVNAGETKKFNFRVKASEGIVNGSTITNTAKVTYADGSLELTKDLPVTTVVGCNNTCTTDDECSAGLTCDKTANKCRKAACVAETDCSCAVVTVAPTITKAAVPTKIATAAATPSILPESGILDLPGVAAFGGGLLLAVVGILLAL